MGVTVTEIVPLENELLIKSKYQRNHSHVLLLAQILGSQGVSIFRNLESLQT